MEFPIIDGHFWVERDGKVIDTDFKEYEWIREYNRCKNKIRYIEASDLIQTVMLGMFNKVLMNKLSVKDMDEAKSKLSTVMDKYVPLYEQCYQNSVIESIKNGGTVKFGSMGWVRKDGSVHYEYGGSEWNTVKAFLK